MRRQRPAAEFITYGVWTVLFGLWQFAPRGWGALWGGRPLLFVPFTVSVAMFTGPIGGGWIGAAAGLFWGIYADAPFGFHAFLLLAIGCAAGLAERFLLRNNGMAALLLCAVATLVVVMADWLWGTLFYLPQGAGVLLRRTGLPNAAHTLVWSWPVYAMMRATAKRLAKRR